MPECGGPGAFYPIKAHRICAPRCRSILGRLEQVNKSANSRVQRRATSALRCPLWVVGERSAVRLLDRFGCSLLYLFREKEMAQFHGSRCSCIEHDTTAFDKRVSVLKPPTADEVINNSAFCTSFQLDQIDGAVGQLTLRDFVSGLDKKVGLYLLWRSEDHCGEHDQYFVRAIYVGKGKALDRVLSHAKKKLRKDELIWVTFYECENFIAKFLEQVFLDIYAFELNKNENPGTQILHGQWGEDRYLYGTEMHHVSNRQRAPRGLDELS